MGVRPENFDPERTKSMAQYSKAEQLSAPNKLEHEAVEEYHRDVLAPEFGVQPAQSMAAQWVGGAEQTGLKDTRPLQKIMFEQLDATASRFGLSREEMIGKIVRGEVPKEALGGAAALMLI